jgi:hypothetical protein
VHKSDLAFSFRTRCFSHRSPYTFFFAYRTIRFSFRSIFSFAMCIPCKQTMSAAKCPKKMPTKCGWQALMLATLAICVASASALSAPSLKVCMKNWGFVWCLLVSEHATEMHVDFWPGPAVYWPHLHADHAPSWRLRNPWCLRVGASDWPSARW